MKQAAHTGTVITGTRKIEKSSVTCSRCHLPNSLDENDLCSFCRRPKVEAAARPIPLRLALMLMVLAGGLVIWVFMLVGR